MKMECIWSRYRTQSVMLKQYFRTSLVPDSSLANP